MPKIITCCLPLNPNQTVDFNFSILQEFLLILKLRPWRAQGQLSLKERDSFVKCALALGLVVGRSQENITSKDLLSQMSLGKVIWDFLGAETKHLKLLASHRNQHAKTSFERDTKTRNPRTQWTGYISKVNSHRSVLALWDTILKVWVLFCFFGSMRERNTNASHR